MKIDSPSLSGVNFKVEQDAAAAVERQRKSAELSVESEPDRNKVATEEILTKIKELTEDGTYSVHFEMNKQTDELVIKIVDKENGDVVRQIPSEELITASMRLQDYRGLILETES